MVDITSRRFRFSTKSLEELQILDTDPELQTLLPYLALVVRYKCMACEFTSDLLSDIRSHVETNHISSKVPGSQTDQHDVELLRISKSEVEGSNASEFENLGKSVHRKYSPKHLEKNTNPNEQEGPVRKSRRLSDKPRKIHSLSSRSKRKISTQDIVSVSVEESEVFDSEEPNGLYPLGSTNNIGENIEAPIIKQEAIERPDDEHLTLQFSTDSQDPDKNNATGLENIYVVHMEDGVLETVLGKNSLKNEESSDIEADDGDLEAPAELEPEAEESLCASGQSSCITLSKEDLERKLKAKLPGSPKKRTERVPVDMVQQDAKLHTCAICEEQLESTADIYAHYRDIHQYVPKQTKHKARVRKVPAMSDQCGYCGRCIKKELLDTHIIMQHIWKPIRKIQAHKKTVLCDICGKVFKYTHNLATHKQQHKGLVPKRQYKKVKKKTFICEVCGFTTFENRRLKDHITYVHEHKFPYKCNECDFQTWERCSFRGHLFRHQASKKYSCDMCSYQCIQRPSLRSHMKRLHGVDLPKNGIHLDYWKKKKLEIDDAENSFDGKSDQELLVSFSDKREGNRKRPHPTGRRKSPKGVKTVSLTEGVEAYIVHSGEGDAGVFPEGYQLEVINETMETISGLTQFETVASKSDGQMICTDPSTAQTYIVQNADGMSYMIPTGTNLEFHVVTEPDGAAIVGDADDQTVVSPSRQSILQAQLQHDEQNVAEALIHITPALENVPLGKDPAEDSGQENKT